MPQLGTEPFQLAWLSSGNFSSNSSLLHTLSVKNSEICTTSDEQNSLDPIVPPIFQIFRRYCCVVVQSNLVHNKEQIYNSYLIDWKNWKNWKSLENSPVKINTESIYIFLLLTDRNGIYDFLRKALKYRFFLSEYFRFFNISNNNFSLNIIKSKMIAMIQSKNQ